jgi:hypothetical protein
VVVSLGGGTLCNGDGVGGTLRGNRPCDVSLTGVYGVVVSRQGGDTWCIVGTYLSAHTVRRTDGRPTTEGLVVSASGHSTDVGIRPGSNRSWQLQVGERNLDIWLMVVWKCPEQHATRWLG